MGFGKLFTKEGKNEARRSSTLSKISNWSHKQSNKRNSQPSPAVSVSSLQHSKSMSHNPFETSPVTPSDSMRDVPSTFTARTSFDHVTSPVSYVPTNITVDNYQEKVELENEEQEEDELHSELLAVALQLDTVDPKNAVEIKHKLGNVNTLLVNALDSSSQLQTKLTTVIASSKQTILSVTEENQELKKDHTAALAGLTEQHVENSELKKKQQDVLTENKTLKEQCQSILDQKLALVEDKTELQEQLDMVTGDQCELKEQVNTLVREKGELTEQITTLRKELALMDKAKNEAQAEYEETWQALKKDMDGQELKIEKLMASDKEMSRQLMDKEEEMNRLKKDLEKYQQLIMKLENDERLLQSEIKASGELANQTQEQHNAVLAQEKLKLEDCTTQIRDLMRNKDKSNGDINKIAQENTQLKDLLEILKEENIGLKEQTEQSQKDILDLTMASTKAATATLDSNDKFEDVTRNQIQALEEENKRLLKLVDHEMDQDSIMRTHKKAQLVLIEYLEGQDDVIQAMAKFKKQLEE